jgi:hypothetical protein
VLLLNPRLEFTDDTQILEDLRGALRSRRFTPSTLNRRSNTRC